jgi:hypothetical protein
LLYGFGEENVAIQPMNGAATAAVIQLTRYSCVVLKQMNTREELQA